MLIDQFHPLVVIHDYLELINKQFYHSLFFSAHTHFYKLTMFFMSPPLWHSCKVFQYLSGNMERLRSFDVFKVIIKNRKVFKIGNKLKNLKGRMNTLHLLAPSTSILYPIKWHYIYYPFKHLSKPNVSQQVSLFYRQHLYTR